MYSGCGRSARHRRVREYGAPVPASASDGIILPSGAVFRYRDDRDRTRHPFSITNIPGRRAVRTRRPGHIGNVLAEAERDVKTVPAANTVSISACCQHSFLLISACFQHGFRTVSISPLRQNPAVRAGFRTISDQAEPCKILPSFSRYQFRYGRRTVMVVPSPGSDSS